MVRDPMMVGRICGLEAEAPFDGMTRLMMSADGVTIEAPDLLLRNAADRLVATAAPRRALDDVPKAQGSLPGDVVEQFGVDLAGLDQFLRAYENLDLALDREIGDCATLAVAAVEIDRSIDNLAACFPDNRMVESMATQMKAIQRLARLQ